MLGPLDKRDLSRTDHKKLLVIHSLGLAGRWLSPPPVQGKVNSQVALSHFLAKWVPVDK